MNPVQFSLAPLTFFRRVRQLSSDHYPRAAQEDRPVGSSAAPELEDGLEPRIARR